MKKENLIKLAEILLDKQCLNDGIVKTAVFLLDKGFDEKELKKFFSPSFFRVAQSKRALNS